MISQKEMDFVKSLDSNNDKARLREQQARIEVEDRLAQIEAENQALLDMLESNDYKDRQIEYVDSLIDDCENNLCDELSDYMKEKDIYVFYQAVLHYVRNRISTEPLSINDNELTFYVIYKDLRKILKDMYYTGSMSNDGLKDRLEKLCDIKLLDNITDDRMSPKALYVANKVADNVSRTMSQEHGKRFKAKRRNHYVLYDLSLQNQLRAMNVVEIEKKYNLRQKSKTSTSLALLHGNNHGVIAQREANINPTKLRNFVNAANYLLKTQGYYTEKQLRIQYMKKDKRIRKKDAVVLTATYLAGVNLRVGAVKARVNVDTREYYSIPSKIKSNSVIYIKER